jgi:NADH-quinone oxidoreductase subunit D
MDEYETLLTDNRIWKQRTVGIGVVTPERALNLGMTGPMLRGSGIAWDLRKKQPYDVYDRWISTFRWARRRLLRPLSGAHAGDAPVQPHHQAVRGLAACQPGPGDHRQPQGGAADRESMKSNMEELIHHFKLFTEGFHVPEGEAYAAVEHPKGEFGIYLVSDGANKPYR